MHLVGFIIRIYHDARSPERQNTSTMSTRNTRRRQTSMSPVIFEPPIPACERQQTHALDYAATVTGHSNHIISKSRSVLRIF